MATSGGSLLLKINALELEERSTLNVESDVELVIDWTTPSSLTAESAIDVKDRAVLRIESQAFLAPGVGIEVQDGGKLDFAYIQEEPGQTQVPSQVESIRVHPGGEIFIAASLHVVESLHVDQDELEVPKSFSGTETPEGMTLQIGSGNFQTLILKQSANVVTSTLELEVLELHGSRHTM